MGYQSQAEVIGLDSVETVGYVFGGLTLSDMGITIRGGLRLLTITNTGSSTLYINNGDVSVTDFQLTTNNRSVSMRVMEATAGSLRFTAAGGQNTSMNVQQEGVQTQ